MAEDKKYKSAEKVDSSHGELKTYYPPFEALPGEYHMVRVDKNGAEIPGSDFSIGPRTYMRTYASRKEFKVKKNPNQ